MSKTPSRRRPPHRPPRMPDDPWAGLRRLTAARIGLKRTGASLATGPLLEFQLAHARARDAVHAPLDAPSLIADLGGLGVPVLDIARAAADRQHHLMPPRPRRRLPPAARRARPPPA